MAANQQELQTNGGQSVQHSTQQNPPDSDHEKEDGVGLAGDKAEDNGGVDNSGGSSGASNFDSEAESSVANTSNELCHATIHKSDVRARR